MGVFQLCNELGGMTVAEMMERMSSQEFIYWCAYMEIEAKKQERK